MTLLVLELDSTTLRANDVHRASSRGRSYLVLGILNATNYFESPAVQAVQHLLKSTAIECCSTKCVFDKLNVQFVSEELAGKFYHPSV